MNDHHCDLWQMWASDPRVPIVQNEPSGIYSLIINKSNHIVIEYCPFCGNKLSGSRDLPQRAKHSCRHLIQMSNEVASSIRYSREDREYRLYGRNSLEVRLFFCPICGRKLSLYSNMGRFYKRSSAEVSALTKTFQNISTIDQAIEQFGQPDVRHGYSTEYLFPKGKRTTIGHKAALFYEHLAKTVVVVVAERLDGQLEVRFNQKEKPKRRNKLR